MPRFLLACMYKKNANYVKWLARLCQSRHDDLRLSHLNMTEKTNMKKTLTKADIVEDIYEEIDKNHADVKNVIENLLEIMKNTIKKDRALLISGFGKFECYDKASRIGRNPQTGATITLPPRKVVVFRLSRKFRVELNS
ncbi:hypothetical protein AGMMS50248_06680 [Deltaproteobacteria bacterium]|nr:hypothetical protein AGMMS50248_06680 [Deltaproteobacteria bacterium]